VSAAAKWVRVVAIFHSDPRPCLRLRGSHQKRSVHSPGINIKGCLSIILNVSGETQRTQSRHQHQRLFVHYTQCIWRNAQRHGLQIAYNKNDDIHLLVRRAAVLPLHPLNTIENYWFNALEDIDSADTNIATLGFTDVWSTVLLVCCLYLCTSSSSLRVFPLLGTESICMS
jgi:hypothetical protein